MTVRDLFVRKNLSHGKTPKVIEDDPHVYLRLWPGVEDGQIVLGLKSKGRPTWTGTVIFDLYLTDFKKTFFINPFRGTLYEVTKIDLYKRL